jgi:transcriptional regulator with XRE-family HTH domain
MAAPGAAARHCAFRPAAEPIDSRVGGRIRALRKERQLSLVTLAERTSLSIGFISQIERGLSSPSLRALTSVADALDVSLSSLFDGPRREQRAADVVVRVAERSMLDSWRSGIHKHLLTAGAPPRFSFFLMTMEPGAASGREFYTHQGEEAGLVLKGRLKLCVDDAQWTLAKGDSFHFASERPHRFENAVRGTTIVAMLNLRRDDRHHDPIP